MVIFTTWFFVFSLYTATGSTEDMKFDDFHSKEACVAFQQVFIEHARAPYGSGATTCQGK